MLAPCRQSLRPSARPPDGPRSLVRAPVATLASPDDLLARATDMAAPAASGAAPFPRIGVLGGGQLGRMLAEAAAPLGMRLAILDAADCAASANGPFAAPASAVAVTVARRRADRLRGQPHRAML